jgi:predicted MPP superfamily phosphohydrolase
MTRRTFVRGTLISTALMAGEASALLLDTHDIEIKHVPLTLGLKQPLRVVALGDFHFDPLCDEDYVKDVVQMVTQLQADLIIYTGDFMTENPSRCLDLAEILSHATSRLGSFAAFGNHEYLAGPKVIRAALQSYGIRVLCNECMLLPGEDNFYLSGIDSYWGKPDLTIFSQTPETSRHILLAHEPDPFRHLDEPRIALQISGHTHGGQIRLPFHGAIHLPPHGRHYISGLFTRSQQHLYVNRGIGALPPFIRFDCQPEITVFHLT